MSATEDATQRTLDPRTLVEIAERSSRILAKAMKRASGVGEEASHISMRSMCSTNPPLP